MEWLFGLFELVLHIDKHLHGFIQDYGGWTYLLLFLIVFCETGLVVTPFLPGDSLLFAAGALAASAGSPLNVWVMAALLFAAAVAGDTLNYWVGAYVGPRVFQQERVRFLKKEHLERTHQFYEKYGGKTIIIARFIPIIRTFAPFVAGIGLMHYGRFLAYNVIGGFFWVAGFVFAGFFFGNIPAVEHNFGLVIVAIIVLSVLPAAVEVVRARRLRPAT